MHHHQLRAAPGTHTNTARATPTQDRNIHFKCTGDMVPRQACVCVAVDQTSCSGSIQGAQTSQAAAQAGQRPCAQAKRHTTPRAHTVDGCVVDRASDQTKKFLRPRRAVPVAAWEAGGPSMEPSKRSHRLHAAIKSSQGGQQTPSTWSRTKCAAKDAHTVRAPRTARCMQMTQSVSQAADPQKADLKALKLEGG